MQIKRITVFKLLREYLKSVKAQQPLFKTDRFDL